jgi:hypothetical protein
MMIMRERYVEIVKSMRRTCEYFEPFALETPIPEFFHLMHENEFESDIP